MGFPSPALDYVETPLTPNSVMSITESSIVIPTDEGYAVAEPGHKVRKGKTVLLDVNGSLMFAEVGDGSFITNDGTIEGDALDNGDTATLLKNFLAAIKGYGSADFLQSSNNLSEISNEGAAAIDAVLSSLGLDKALAGKAGLNGDSNETFYAQANGGDTAVVNNARLNSVLSSYAYLGGSASQGFAVAGGTNVNSAVAYGQFQSGTNGNGAWTKIPGGGQWCRQNLTLTANATTTWTFPAGFVAAPAVFVTAINGAFQCWLNGIGANNCGIYNNGTSLNVNLYAVW